MWYEESLRLKPDKAIVKLRNADGSFMKSIAIPSAAYPLNGKYTVFHCENTEPVTDEQVLALIDEAAFRNGHCYSNTAGVVSKLQAAGYDASAYVGWLFTSESQFPAHHCWCVLDGRHVIDLSDDFTLMFSGSNGDRLRTAKGLEDARRLMVSFALWSKQFPNHERCAPVGSPSPILLYVGCKCDPEDGKEIYRELMKKFPYHECRRDLNSDHINPTQKMMQTAGLL